MGSRAGLFESLCAMSLTCVLAACAVGPDFVRPAGPATLHYEYSEEPARTIATIGGAQRFEYGEKVAADWWQLFECPKLDGMVMLAIANSPTLQAAQAALRQSEDNLRAGYGIFYPQLGASFQPSRVQFSPVRFGQNVTPSIFSLYTLSTTVTYVLDVFGGERRTVESLGAQTDVQYYNALGTYLTLSGNVVNAIVAEAAYQAESEATEQIVGFLQEQVNTTAAQAEAGTGSICESTQHSNPACNCRSDATSSPPAARAHASSANHIGRPGT
jgi:outer membrane protein TolC